MHPRLAHGQVRRVATTTILWLVFLANVAFIVVLWLRGDGASGVHHLGDLLTSLGRITGLLGAYLLLARLTVLERLTGLDRLTVWHRRNGRLALYLVLAHLVLITIGYALTDCLSIPAEASQLLGSYPSMVTATVGTGFLALVVLTSLVIVRRRLRYEAWYLVHLMAYAGIVLSWFHEVPTGNEFITNPGATAYWTALYLATLAVLVLFRFALPIVQGFWYHLRVEQVIPESASVVSLRITGRHLDRLHARAGRFFL